uniref:(northern house mosquito) hypothetical protein n=1 Tax=Culex pipiens TaxID=7175 RepID=A0A8D8HQJ9_CULPI
MVKHVTRGHPVQQARNPGPLFSSHFNSNQIAESFIPNVLLVRRTAITDLQWRSRSVLDVAYVLLRQGSTTEGQDLGEVLHHASIPQTTDDRAGRTYVTT